MQIMQDKDNPRKEGGLQAVNPRVAEGKHPVCCVCINYTSTGNTGNSEYTALTSPK